MQNFEYHISVLIPVYNAQDTLEETIESVLGQKIDEYFDYEILLINDGSSDESEKICLNYTEKFSFIKYVSHENRGVSYTRNRGLDLAQGKYILFLDADDLIGEETLAAVYETFEKYNEHSDILAYPIYSLSDGEITKHPRTENYKLEALYDVDGFAFLNQVTMNIVVKNLDEKIYFDEELFQSEDAYFNANMIFKTRKLIISDKGSYLYRTNRYSTVQKYSNPVAIGSKLLELFEKYCANFTKNGIIPPYIQSSILYEINWRFKANSLFPFHLTGLEWDEWNLRFLNILNQISDEVLLKQKFMDYYHKIYFLEKKYGSQLSIENDSENIYLKREDFEILRFNKFTLVFDNMNIEKNKLEFSGYIKAPVLNYLKGISLIIYKDNKVYMQIHSFTLAADSRYKSKQITNTFYRFNISMPITDGQYKFVVSFNGLEYLTNHYFLDFVLFKKYLDQKYLIEGGKYISYYSNPFCINIVPVSRISAIKHKLVSQMNLVNSGYKNIALFKAAMLFVPDNEIWIYNDRINVFDNSYLQFKHDFYKNDGIRRYYVTYDNENLEGKFTKEEEKYLVKYNSIQHKILVYKSSVIITSFQNVYEYCPFSNIALNLLHEKLSYKVIYLQHGILHAHTPWIYSKDKTRIDYFLTSSNYEKEMLINNYNYSSKDIINLLMPRFEEVVFKEKENKILFAPSWRISLTNGIKDLEWQLDDEKFKQSTYYREINRFINNRKLETFLIKHDLILDFNLHPIFKGYSHCFEIKSSRIKLVTEIEVHAVYKLFITDFSSLVFDFVKLNIPVVFYVPDYDEFLSGNHIYNKLEIDLNDNFGPLLIDQNRVIEELDRSGDNKFSVTDKYLEKYNNFFNKIDNPKEVLYLTILEITK